MQFSMMRFLFCTASTIFLTLPALIAAQQPATVSVSKQNPPFAEKISVRGVKDAGKVNDHLYRGSQPDVDALPHLQKLGITKIVNLRAESRDLSDDEKNRAEKLGIEFVLIPGDPWAPPTDEQVAEFFSAVAERPQQTIFIHCWLGRDRTGVFVAAYRIAFEHWTPEQAIAEMYKFHFDSLWHPSMKDYVRNFPGRLANSKAFAPYRSISPGSLPSPDARP